MSDGRRATPRRNGGGKAAATERRLFSPSDELMAKVGRAFERYGYEGITMVELAVECGFTRRSLYNYFTSKEDAFRAVIRFDNVRAVANGMRAAHAVRRQGGSALEVLAEALNVRYGEVRRRVNQSPHLPDLAAEAFRRGQDIMVEFALSFRAEIETLIGELEADGLLRLRRGLKASEVAQLLLDGARGTNQSLPPVPPPELAERYYRMTEAILVGCAHPPEEGEGDEGARLPPGRAAA